MTAPAVLPASRLEFDLPDELIATAPVEATGGRRRDDARLLVAHRHDDRLVDATFARLAEFLDPGDVLVVNRSGTLPAAVPTLDGLLVHFSTELPGGSWVVELRRPCGTGSLPYGEGRPGQVLLLSGGARVELREPFGPAPAVHGSLPDRDGPKVTHERGVRLWVAQLALPQAGLTRYLLAHGHPIRYGCLTDAWPIDAYQTVFATEPGSAEMPSASRAFTPELLERLRQRGVKLAPITLHTGVSSQEAGEAPYPERYAVPAATAATVNRARRRGRRVLAVGTTAVRAVETVAGPDGSVRGGAGWTDTVITPERGVRAVDGLITGWHEPEASHLLLLEAVAGRPVLERSYQAALALGYRWHEFGDLHLILR